MKSTLIYSTSKPDYDRRNELTIERLKRKKQREILKKYSNDSLNYNKKDQNNNNQQSKYNQNTLLPYHKYSHDFSLNGLMFFELNTDAIEQQKLNILLNSELPIVFNRAQTVQSYFSNRYKIEHSIGWLIAEYVLKFNR
jgi:hypothetical protein